MNNEELQQQAESLAAKLAFRLGLNTPSQVNLKALLPFYLALFLVLMAVTYIPAISLWLPSVVL